MLRKRKPYSSGYWQIQKAIIMVEAEFPEYMKLAQKK